MPICPRCRSEYEAGAGRCTTCSVSLLDLVGGDAEPLSERRPRGAAPTAAAEPAPRADDAEEPVEPDLEPLRLLMEEPLPEVAGMIQEFLENCGIGCVVHNETIGLLYRLPASLSQARVYVRESDYDEARELVAHFFKPS